MTELPKITPKSIPMETRENKFQSLEKLCTETQVKFIISLF